MSTSSNIAEGQDRRSDQGVAHFLRIAHGSLQEAETQIMLSRQLGYCAVVAEEQLLAEAGDVGRLKPWLGRSLAHSLTADN